MLSVFWFMHAFLNVIADEINLNITLALMQHAICKVTSN